MTPEAALEALRAAAVPGKADEMRAYHKLDRPYLGVANPDIDLMAREWRQSLPLDARLSLAAGLWGTNIHEARIAAAKLLTQARIRPDDEPAWQLIQGWVPDFDAWAIADHACIAAQKRLAADPARLDQVEGWTQSPLMWARRAALVATLHLTRLTHPKPDEIAARERVLAWAEGYLGDPDWFIQKAVGWWLRDLSKHDPDRARAFLAAHGDRMKPFARREAARHLA
ncbi:DNA alkylation repair protein [Cereibacter sphaeroides]|uniref:DNA alkylation repair protein n=1 Tax=Cereibacter sphaeroides TaxID=1063 RepID=UPI001F2F08FB|nr:DNA alkylation repair protein [Cereibacter sphaeroides]MCE6960385.1 DNA alkylation repair protein [Cereibacter sphaeroides]MCE6975393.1 DNA alkylation repair protein [Cereibacter sphaeroides]